MASFERFIGIDWSGASEDHRRVNLAVAIATTQEAASLVRPPTDRSRRWTRQEAGSYLSDVLATGAPRTLVGIDAAIGYPYGTERAVFGVDSWSEMVTAISERYPGTASAFADLVNADFEPGGAPFRRNHNRNDVRFHLEHDVAYYRQADLVVPQAISPFYLGSGAAVGYHTITAFVQLAKLFQRRRSGDLHFLVWPHETGPLFSSLQGDAHVIAEVYPALLDDVEHDGSGDERDALKVAGFLRQCSPEAFDVPRLSVGRAAVDWVDQIETEGWILGVDPVSASQDKK